MKEIVGVVVRALFLALVLGGLVWSWVVYHIGQPIAMVDGEGGCVYFTIIKNDREVEDKCPQNWKKFQTVRVSSQKELEEMKWNLASKGSLQAQEKEILLSLRKELEKRARIARQE